MRRRPRDLVAQAVAFLSVLAVVTAAFAPPVPPASAASTTVVISEFRPRGPQGGNDEFVELFNLSSAPVDVGGWKINGSNATGTVGTRYTIPAGTTLAPGQHLLIVNTGSNGYSGSVPPDDPAGYTTGITDDGGVALLRADNSIVDQVGMSAGSAYKEGSPLAGFGSTNGDRSYRRTNQCADTDNNVADFAAASPSGPQNRASPPTPCTQPPGDQPPSISSSTPADQAANVAVGSSITVTFSEDVTAPASAFSLSCNPGGSRAVAVSGGPRTFTVDPTQDLPSGASCTLTVDDAQVQDVDSADPPDTMAADGLVRFATAQGVIPIGQVQGSVGDSDNGSTHASPLAGTNTVVTVQGVLYQKTLARTNAGGSNHGFFLQNTRATADSDPNSSDGIFVFLGSNQSIPRAGGGSYTPQVGDEIVLSGRVTEFSNLTQISGGLRLEQVVRSGVNLDADLPAFEANPPFDGSGASDPAEVNRYWERREGMRARVPAGSIVTGPTVVFAGSLDGEVRVIHPAHPVAQRSEQYARRTFRDPHPLDNVPSQLFDDGNAYRILLGSLGVKAAAGDNTRTIAPSARTFDTLSAPSTGGVYYAFGKYSVQVEAQPTLAAGPDPSRNAPPGAPDRDREYSLATFNVENLYDFRDDPTDGCDFADDGGCPNVRPPFNYVPASDAAYRQHLDELAAQIVGDLHAPDILMIQEAEDQDICVLAPDRRSLACDTTNNPTPDASRDGKPDTLQELALAIRARGGPEYEAAFDRNGADDRGIVSAFMFRRDRVELRPATAAHPVLGGSPTVSYRGAALPYNADVQNPKVLNAVLPTDIERYDDRDGDNVYTRAPQVGSFRIWRQERRGGPNERAGGPDELPDRGRGVPFVDLYVISNHFSSGPDTRIGQRREQAAYLAAIVTALRAADPGVQVAVGGDFNVFPRPDDPVPPPRPPSDQLGPLYDLGLNSLWDRLAAEAPAAAYSYVFDHQAQTLDQIFVTDSLLEDLVQVRVAHVNSDWPRDFPGDGPRGASDHDPSVARFRFRPPHP